MIADREDIQIADIEKELGKLHDTHKALEFLPACLFNLVIYCQDTQRIPYIEQIKQSIVNKFPCRIIFVQEGPDPKQNYLRVDVSSETVGKIICDQIIIEASPCYLQRVPFIIFPHLVPDLPLYLLWCQDPTKDQQILPHLAPLANRLIYKPNTCDDFTLFSQKIIQLNEQYPKLDLIDIHWILTAEWRNILKQVFDTLPHFQQLKLSKSIRIFYNDLSDKNDQSNELQAFYLLQWLMSRLEWDCLSEEKKEGEHFFICGSASHSLQAILSPQSRKELYPGTVIGFDLASSNDFFFVISPIPNLAKVNVHISELERCALPFTLPLSSLKPGFQYVKELFFMPTGDHYLQMLKRIAHV